MTPSAAPPTPRRCRSSPPLAAVWARWGRSSLTRWKRSSPATKSPAGRSRTWPRASLILPIVAEAVHGQDAVIIPDKSVAREGRETGGLKATLSSLGLMVKGQVQQAAETVEKGAGVVKDQAQSAVESVQKVAEKSVEAAKKEAEIVKERAGELKGKAQEQVGRHVQETAGKGVEAVKHEADVVKERPGRSRIGRRSKADEAADAVKETGPRSWPTRSRRPRRGRKETAEADGAWAEVQAEDAADAVKETPAEGRPRGEGGGRGRRGEGRRPPRSAPRKRTRSCRCQRCQSPT